MKVAVMQPYIFPYLGYYQLVSAVDTFVFFDDVNFINKGWVNRNQILQSGEPLKFTIPLSKASQNKLINEIELSGYNTWKKVFLKSIDQNYKKAPHFVFVFNWLNEFLNKEFLLINNIASESIKSVSKILGLPTEFKNSSAIAYKNESDQDGQQKVLTICKLLGADKYINPRNGQNLYNKEKFKESKIQLNFIWMSDIIYNQFSNNQFVPSLSIIDVLMFNSIEETKKLLLQFTLN